jgi:hypothetical protein
VKRRPPVHRERGDAPVMGKYYPMRLTLPSYLLFQGVSGICYTCGTVTFHALHATLLQDAIEE